MTGGGGGGVGHSAIADKAKVGHFENMKKLFGVGTGNCF